MTTHDPIELHLVNSWMKNYLYTRGNFNQRKLGFSTMFWMALFLWKTKKHDGQQASLWSAITTCVALKAASARRRFPQNIILRPVLSLAPRNWSLFHRKSTRIVSQIGVGFQLLKNITHVSVFWCKFDFSCQVDSLHAKRTGWLFVEK